MRVPHCNDKAIRAAINEIATTTEVMRDKAKKEGLNLDKLKQTSPYKEQADRNAKLQQQLIQCRRKDHERGL